MKNDADVETSRIERPRNFEITVSEDCKKITRSWYSIMILLPVLMTALVFNGVWIGQDFFGILSSDKSLLLKAFALLFIVLGLLLIYYSLATFFNRTDIVVNRDFIEIRHYPVPWMGNKKWATADIDSLLAKATYWGSADHPRNHQVNLFCLTAQGEQLKILSGLQAMNQAKYIKQEIESYWAGEDEENDSSTV